MPYAECPLCKQKHRLKDLDAAATVPDRSPNDFIRKECPVCVAKWSGEVSQQKLDELQRQINADLARPDEDNPEDDDWVREGF